MNSTNQSTKDGPRINVFNKQRKLQVDIRSLRDFLAKVKERLNLQAGLSVVFVSDSAIQRINSRFAGKNYPTDVLSFPADEDSEPYLGDIIISVESADRQRQGSLAVELEILVLHGVLHLLGYDHEVDGGEMESLEKALREEFDLR